MPKCWFNLYRSGVYPAVCTIQLFIIIWLKNYDFDCKKKNKPKFEKLKRIKTLITITVNIQTPLCEF